MLAERIKIVRVQQTVAASGFTLSDYICTKNVEEVLFVITHAGTNDTDLTLALREATKVDGVTAAAVTATFPIHLDGDHGTSSDIAVRQTDAASYVLDPATVGAALVLFTWRPVKHTEGYNCIAVSGSGGHGSNTVTIVAVCKMKYEQASLPSVIID